jgi:hypothetical protein
LNLNDKLHLIRIIWHYMNLSSNEGIFAIFVVKITWAGSGTGLSVVTNMICLEC